MLAGEKLAGAPHASLDLVADHQHAVLPADAGALGQIAGRRHDHPCLALHRLDQERRRIGRDRRFERAGIAERDRLESGRERSEAVAVLRFRRESDDRDRAAVKVAGAHDHLGLSVGNALDLVSPLAHRFQRRLDGFGAAVRRQRARKTGHFGQPLQKKRQLVVVEGARGHRQLLRLRDQRRDDAGMRMPVTDGRIRAHHVEKTPAVDVPQPSALAVRHHHRQRVVVACAEGLFDVDKGRARFGFCRLAGVEIALLHSVDSLSADRRVARSSRSDCNARAPLGSATRPDCRDVDARTRLAAGWRDQGWSGRRLRQDMARILPSKQAAKPAALHKPGFPGPRAAISCGW